MEYKTKDHPTANGHQPAYGDEEYIFMFPLENGEELRIKAGKETLRRFRDIILSYDIDIEFEKIDAVFPNVQ